MYTVAIGHLLQPIEDSLRHDLIPAITGRQAINDVERRMFALPTRLGGLGIEVLPEVADQLYSNSKKPLDGTFEELNLWQRGNG